MDIQRQKKKCFFYDELGQSASELMIFGGILIFVIGLIFRAGFGANLQLHEQLRAQRIAFTESYKTGQNQYTTQAYDSAARNTASVLIVEDRLSVEPAEKTGTRDRIPFILSASGTFSRNLFLTAEPWHEPWNLKLVDYIINGQRFPFVMESYPVLEFSRDTLPLCAQQNAAYAPHKVAPVLSEDAGGPRCWEERCLKKTLGIGVEGCPVIYRIERRGDPDWCSGMEADGTLRECEENLVADYRYDLNLDGDLADEDDVLVNEQMAPPQEDIYYRNSITWQWVRVPIVPPKREKDLVLDAFDWDGFVTGTPFDFSEICDEIVDPNSEACKYENDPNQRRYKILKGGETTCKDEVCTHEEGDFADIDGDKDYEEEAWSITFAYEDDGTGYNALRRVFVRVHDKGGGELDLYRVTKESDPRKISGLKMEEMQMFTFTGENTYLQIEEGELLGESHGQVLLSTVRQDSTDIITRRIVLNKDLGRFCEDDDGDGVFTPRTWGVSDWAKRNAVYGITNPVEVCEAATQPGTLHPCFKPENMAKTCMQIGDPAREIKPEIWVRSRIKDRRMRRWITPME